MLYKMILYLWSVATFFPLSASADSLSEYNIMMYSALFPMTTGLPLNRPKITDMTASYAEREAP